MSSRGIVADPLGVVREEPLCVLHGRLLHNRAFSAGVLWAAIGGLGRQAAVHALRCEHQIIDASDCGMSMQQLRVRAEEIAECDWASEAIRQAIGEIMAAVVAATSAAAAIGSVTWR